MGNTSMGESAEGGVEKDPGSVAISVEAASNTVDDVFEVLHCKTLTGKNVTNAMLDGCDLSHMVGQSVRLHIAVDGGALLYTVGFASAGAGVARANAVYV